MRLERATIAIHLANMKAGDPAVWLVEDLDTGTLWAAESWESEAASSEVGLRPHGPTAWVETARVWLSGAKPASAAGQRKDRPERDAEGG